MSTSSSLLELRLAVTEADCRRAVELMQPQAELLACDLEPLRQMPRKARQDQPRLLLAELSARTSAPPVLLGAMVVHCQSDHSLVLFPPLCAENLAEIYPEDVAANGCRELQISSRMVQNRLMEFSLQYARQQNCHFVQCLRVFCEPENREKPRGKTAAATDFQGELLTRHGLPLISTLHVLLRPGNSGKLSVRQSAAGKGVRQEKKVFRELIPVLNQYTQPEFAQLIEETYQDSADFPELLGKKTGAQAVKTHALQGEFNPFYWYFIRQNNVTCGVLLLARHPPDNQWELIYLGILPKFRRQGLARYAIRQVLSNEEIGNRPMFLGMDSRNVCAARLYESLGFALAGRYLVHFGWLNGPA